MMIIEIMSLYCIFIFHKVLTDGNVQDQRCKFQQWDQDISFQCGRTTTAYDPTD